MTTLSERIIRSVDIDEIDTGDLLDAAFLLELQAKEISLLKTDALRWRWLFGGGLYDLPYKDHGNGPEFDLSPEAVDAAMQQQEKNT